MILRRPYAFLIKYFRIIHLVLFVLFGYMTYKANNILSFFKDYISYNGNVNFISNEYISYFIFVAVLLIIVISVFIYYLMRFKNKPRLVYIILIVVSIISSVLFIYLHNGIRLLETTVQSGRTIRLYRDISRFNLYILFITCIPVLIRGLGFDVKKFNFNKDLNELKLDEKDNEEVEVNIDLSSDGVKRTGRKLFREFKYYYGENKFFINIIIGVVGVILLIIGPINYLVFGRNLTEGEVLGTNSFNIRINESYITDRKRISKDNSYVILKVELKGKASKYILNLDQFVLEGKNNDYVPSLKYYYYFSDLGVGYRNNVLDTKEYKEYLLIYNIKNEDKNKKFKFKYIVNGRKIKLSPEVID